MDQELRSFIYNLHWCQSSVQEVVQRLPASDTELDEWLDGLLRSRDGHCFIYTVYAALLSERPVDARHLVQGAGILANDLFLGVVAMHMQGEVGEFILKAAKESVMAPRTHAMALLISGVWCMEHREGVLPAALLTEARLLGRRKGLDNVALAYLWALARAVKDDGLAAVLTSLSPGSANESVIHAAEKVGVSVLDVCRGPVINMIPVEPSHVLGAGMTMRRAVARTGRNDPCPCGSGRKYKHCCHEKDQDRLRLSTDVAGKTAAELHEAPETELTETRLKKLPAFELARLDPLKIEPKLRHEYFMHLVGHNLQDAAVDALEKLGIGDDLLSQTWDFVIWQVSRTGRKDLADRLMAMREGDETLLEKLRPSTRFILARDDPAALLKVLEEVSLKALQMTDSEKLTSFACGLLTSSLPTLGIFVARSLIPLTKKSDAVFLMDQILETRDRLKLSPNDPFSDVIDKRFSDEVSDAGKDAEALRKARDKLEAKAGEVRQMQASLDGLRRDLEQREKVPAPAPSSAITQQPQDDAELRDMRDKVRMLKSALNERHQERASLRRDLQKAYTDLQELRKRPDATPQSQAESISVVESEDELVLPGEVTGNQPPRLIEFPHKFKDVLTSFPRQVTRSTLILLGRLAAGELGAFAGVVRLKACPDVLRLRIGRDHRLLFRLLPECLQVVDLINRRDLEKRIKSL